jgi:hypothetical protein
MPALPRSFRPVLLALGLAAALGAHAGDKPKAAASEGFSAGLTIREIASPDQMGLPAYPGARTYTESKDDKPGVTLGAWGGAFGLHVHALKLQSADKPEAVARWYLAQLQGLGPVLDCSQGPAADPPPLPDKQADKKLLRCGDDRPKPGGALYKVGSRADSRVVAVSPAEGGSRIALVRVQVKGDE